MYLCLIVPAITHIIMKLYQKWICVKCKSDAQMTNKVVIVTGANTGIGFETAKDLARRGARVILACRNMGRGTAALNKIVQATGNNNVVVKHLDLASFDSVRAFAEDIIQTETALHVLINNAGMGLLDNSLTEDDLPIEQQTNYFGPFLLTTLLVPLLKRSAPSRIVNVASADHHFGEIDFDTFHMQAMDAEEFGVVYANTKLATIMFTRKLSVDLQSSGVTVNSLHPGEANTDICRHHPGFVRIMYRIAFKTASEAAQTSIHLAVAPEVENVTGKYFVDCQEKEPSELALEDSLAKQLWELSERVVSNTQSKKND